MNIDIPKPKSATEFEIRIDPDKLRIHKSWFNCEVTDGWQKYVKESFLDARKKGKLKPFTCMTIDPSIDPKTKRLVYKQGLQPATNLTLKQCEQLIREYAPSRNSRQMTETAYICRTIFLVHRLVESGYEPKRAWYMVCTDSTPIGHYSNSHTSCCKIEPTGSRALCGFYDLANTYKVLISDSWKENNNNLILASGDFHQNGYKYPVGCILRHFEKGYKSGTRVPMLCLD